MEAKDLRIGNWVKNPNNGEYSQIIPMDISDIYLKIKSREGIDLTPSILLRCGFEKEESCCERNALIFSFQVSNTDSLYFDDGKFYISHEWNNNHFKNTFWNQPKYVHQLQNLIYFLSGKELEIKL